MTLSDTSGTLSGTLTVAAVGGVATFGNLVVTKAGTDFLYASDSTDSLSDYPSVGFSIAPAAASQLLFTTQPTSAAAGGTMATVKVTIEDKYGNFETADNSNVTLTDATGTLSGTIPKAASAGLATFNDLSVTRAGSDHLYAADAADGLSDFASNSFNISPVAASQLVFTTQPAAAFAGQILPTVKVTIEDKYENVETADHSTVSLTDDSGTLAGTTSEAAVNGVATFSNLSVTAMGSDHLYAADAADGLSDFASNSFTIMLPPSQLVFVQQPASTPAGAKIRPSVTVDIENADNDLVTSDNSNVTLSDTSGTLGGTRTVAAVGGVATFSNLVVTKVGTDSLRASDSTDGLSGFASNNFSVTPGAAGQLVFTTQPVNGIAGQTMASVQVDDRGQVRERRDGGWLERNPRRTPARRSAEHFLWRPWTARRRSPIFPLPRREPIFCTRRTTPTASAPSPPRASTSPLWRPRDWCSPWSPRAAPPARRWRRCR